MSIQKIPVGVKEIRLTAVVHRADGSTEELGEVAYWHPNPFRRFWWNIKTKKGGVTGGIRRSNHDHE